MEQLRLYEASDSGEVLIEWFRLGQIATAEVVDLNANVTHVDFTKKLVLKDPDNPESGWRIA